MWKDRILNSLIDLGFGICILAFYLMSLAAVFLSSTALNPYAIKANQFLISLQKENNL